MITIIDYGMGNLWSVYKAFRRLNIESKITSSPYEIEQAEKLILPGVGHFKNGMNKLRELKLIDILNKKVLEEQTPILGICLGMQLFTEHSEEGDVDGLGWVKAMTIKFDLDGNPLNLKIPHMGWNNIEIKKTSKLISNASVDSSFYFVHSYYVECKNQNDILSTTIYGKEFVSAIHVNNIFATQFHPEKSHKNGLQLLKNFSEI